MLGSRSGLDWLLDRYRASTHKASGIVNDPNDWSREAGNPRCAFEHVAIVSPHTQQTVAASPRMDTDGPKT